MNFYLQLFWQGLLAAFILYLCYVLIKIIVRQELKSSVPNQIKAAQKFFKGKSIRLILLIDKTGKTEWEHFEVVKEPDYVG